LRLSDVHLRKLANSVRLESPLFALFEIFSNKVSYLKDFGN